jgi:hypothetical protein
MENTRPVTTLSPEAQAIRTQAFEAYWSRATTEIDLIVAATLRAAAGHICQQSPCRRRILDIAAELEER